MSTNNYSLSDYGFLITKEIAAYIVLAYDKITDSIPEEVQKLLNENRFAEAAKHADTMLPKDYNDVLLAHDILESRWNQDSAYCSEFTGCAKSVMPGCDAEHNYENEFLVYIPAKNEPELLRAAYPDANSIIHEFEEIMDGILPKDFNYMPYITKIQGTYCC